jgi:hypothetical protein
LNLPNTNEYNPYFEKYINLVPSGIFLDVFQENTMKVIQFFKNIPLEKLDYRYAVDKWTCKDILMHIIDTERVMSYRVLVAMRGDSTTPLAPVDENLYARNVDVSSRSIDDLLEEFEIVRRSSEKLFRNMTDEQSRFLGNGVNHPISPRALGYIIQGHAIHHMNVIKERYL